MMTETNLPNKIHLEHEEVGTEGYVTRKYTVIMESNDLTTKEIITLAEEQFKKIKGD